MSVHVFVDESVRGAYIMCAVLLRPTDLAETRKLLRGLCRPGQRRVHFAKESNPRRRHVLAELARTSLRARVYLCHRNDQVAARRACVYRLAKDCVDAQAGRLVLESVSSLNGRDELAILDALHDGGGLWDVPYAHMHAYEEPMLWPADAIAWAYGVGGDWLRRVDPLIENIVAVP